jgi:hypothetical protein
LTDCVVQPPPAGHDRDRIFEEKSENLSLFSDKTVRTAKMVAVGTSTGNKKIAEALLATSGQVTSGFETAVKPFFRAFLRFKREPFFQFLSGAFSKMDCLFFYQNFFSLYLNCFSVRLLALQ